MTKSNGLLVKKKYECLIQLLNMESINFIKYKNAWNLSF